VSLNHLICPIVLIVLSGGCATDPEAELTRDEAAEVAKGDDVGDICEEQGWYGDRICDTFCRKPDPDCDGAILLNDSDIGTTAIVKVGTDVLVQLWDRDSAPGADWQVVLTDRTFATPIETLRAGELVQFRWTTESIFDLSGFHAVDMELRAPGAALPSGRFSFNVDIRP
jgi:hypothetical protein